MSYSKRKIAVVTGSRAEYGLLYWLMKEIQGDSTLQLQVIVTGMHLSPEFGLTWRNIEQDGFLVDAKVEMLLSSDTPVGIAKSMGLGVIGFAEALDRLHPDIIVLLGDRFEILAVAQAALVAKIPVAHIAGGDVTEGAYDELIRHAITKMAHLHFVTNADAARRVRQMGENPQHVHNVGSPGIDAIKRMQLLDRATLARDLGFEFREKNLLVTFHPATLENASAGEQFAQLLIALDRLGSGFGIVFTKPNADNEGRVIMQMIERYVQDHPNARGYASLGQLRYLSLMAQVDAVVGNSSSGLYEAPSLACPTVNIGDRQKGRLRADSVLDCAVEATAVENAIRQALTLDCSKVVNPYGDGESSLRIKQVLATFPVLSDLLHKRFCDVGQEHA